MESQQAIDPLIQSSVTTAARFYNNRQDATALTVFENKLDALISATCVSTSCMSLDVENLSTIECLSYCVSCLSALDCPSSLANKIVTAFTNIVSTNVAARLYLQNSLQLSSCLTTYLTSALNRKEIIPGTAVKCVKLLQLVTYQTDCCTSSNACDLINLMIVHLLKAEDDLTPFCLGVLTNMCTQSMLTRDYIRKLDNVRQLYKLLMNYLSHASVSIVIPALSLVSRLSDELRERVFSNKNMVQTFQCMFNVLIKGDSMMARHYACDLFRHILNYQLMEQIIAGYAHLDAALKQVCTLLLKISASSEQLFKVYELLLAFCKRPLLKKAVCVALRETPPIDCRLTTPLLAIVEVIRIEPQQCALPELPLLGLRLLTAALELVTQSNQRVLEYFSNEVLLSLIEECLKSTIETKHRLVRLKCERLVRCLQLVLVLTADADLCNDLQEVCNVALCGHLAEFQLLSNPIAMAPGTPGTGHCSPLPDWSTSGVDLLLNLLLILDKLGTNSSSHHELHVKLLKDPRLLAFLAFAVTSDNKERVQNALRLIIKYASLHDEDFQPHWLGSLIAANISTLSVYARTTQASDAALCLTPQPCSNSHNGNASSGRSLANGFADGAYKHQLNGTAKVDHSAIDNEKLDELIAAFKGGMDIKDAKISPLIEVYERKLFALEAKERQLQDLLEAKNVSLQNADRLVSQYRGQGMQSDNETQKLRSLILEAELKTEEANRRLQSLQVEIRQLKNEVRQKELQVELREKDIETWKDAETENKLKIAGMQKTVEASRKEIENEKELHSVLRKHYDAMKLNFEEASQKLLKADEENKSLKKQLKEKETEVFKNAERLEKLGQTIGTKEEEISCLEKNVEKLQSQMQALEKEKRLALKQLADSQNEVSRRCALIRDHETTIESLKEKIAKFEEIQKMIRGLTGDK